MNKVWSVVAGTSGILCQQSSELKTLSKETKLRVCASAGVKQKAKLTAWHQLAMKSKLQLTWSQARSQKRFLKEVGVEYDSEMKERKLRDTPIH